MTASTTETTAPQGALGRYLFDPSGANSEMGHRLLSLLMLVLPMLLVLVGAALALLVGVISLRRRAQRVIEQDARYVVVAAPPEVAMAGASILWTNLHDILHPRWDRFWRGQAHVAFEILWRSTGITIGFWVPRAIPLSMVTQAIESAWPGARTSVVSPTPVPLGMDGQAVGGELRLRSPEWFPIETSHDADPLRSVFGAIGSLGENEAAALQILARPVSGRRLARAHRAARLLRNGTTTSPLLKMLDLVTPGTTHPVADELTRSGDVRVILNKIASPGWEACVRYGVATSVQLDGAAGGLKARAHGLASAFALYGGSHNRLERRRLRSVPAVLATRRLGRGDLLSVPELAALAHLPYDVVVPGLSRAGAQSVAPTPDLPTIGKVFGDSEVGVPRPVAIAPIDARYHLHVMGSTGVGKSTLLTNLILGDVQAGRGAVVIDPKSDLVTDVLDRLPGKVANKVVLLDPFEKEMPIGMNVLEGKDPDLVVDNIVGIFRNIFAAYWGPRTDDVLRAACLTLRTKPGSTLVDVSTLLTDSRFRSTYTDKLNDSAGLGGFWRWYDEMGAAQQNQVVGPLMNKLRAFMLRPFTRNLLGLSESSFDMSKVLDGGLLLVRLPKGVVGEDTARLVGSLVVARVWQTVTARAQIVGAQRRDSSLYVDECQNFLTMPQRFDDVLTEARGYGLSMTLAHQHLAQLPRDLCDAVSSNARNKVLFSMSPEDAMALRRHFAPELNEHDLSHLGAYQVAARLMAGGQEQPACTITTRPAPAPIEGRAEEIRATSRRIYGRPQSDRTNRDAQQLLSGRRQVGSRPSRTPGNSIGTLSTSDSNSLESPGRGAVGPAATNPDFLGDE